MTKARELTSDKEFCTTFHATDAAYAAEKISYWTTPQKKCVDGSGDNCTAYSEWVDKWQQIRGDTRAERQAWPRLPLVPPMAWLIVAYLGSLAVLLFSAFWSVDEFTGSVVRTFTTDNIVRVFTDAVFRTATLRTLGIALTVTVICAVLAVPLALFMAKVASRRMRLAMVVAVTTPLWASYLVKAYATADAALPGGPAALGDALDAGYGLVATILTLSYLWLPYMVIPVFAALERVPDHLIDASSDLGASDLATLARSGRGRWCSRHRRGVDLHLLAGLGDYIAVTIVGGKTQMLGNIIYGQLVTANNQPLAAALSLIPLTAIVLYLLAMRRTGALENV